IASIPANTTLQYTFASTLNLSATGLYDLVTIVDDSSDTFHANDTARLQIRNSPLVTSFPYRENFEGGDAGFYAEGTNSSWAYGTPASPKINGAASGVRAWKTRLAGNYNDDELSYLYSPCFNLAGLLKPTLSFSVALDLEDCGAALCDGARVEYSADGKTWIRLDTTGGALNTNWYNKPYRVWSVENYKRWHVVSCALPDSIDVLRFRIAMISDGSLNLEGIAVDDIHVYDNTSGIYDGPTMTTGVTTTVSGNNWIHFETGGKLIASVHPSNQNLGATEVQAFVHAGAVRSTSTQYYHNRNITVKPFTNSPPDSVSVRFYFLDSESEALINATGCTGCAKPGSAYEMGLSKYSDVDDAFENGSITDNSQGTWSFILPADVVKWPFDKGYYAEFKVKSFSEFWLNSGGFNRATPLPVKLLDFSARLVQGNVVSLAWRTENEVNIRRFDIEMSDGILALQANRFTKIDELESRSAAGAVQDYTYLDKTFSGSGIRYYRLRIVEEDGSVSYSQVRGVQSEPVTEWKIYPNPSDGLYHLLFQADLAASVSASVFDAQGKIIQRYKQTGTGFAQKLTVNLKEAHFANGMYLLQVETAGKKTFYKLYKQ
ncbi:MAG: T9SS type A sorting domain-containing protein, partial [Chitinophagaceae bacterium]